MSTPLADVSSFDTMNGPVGTDIRNAAGVRALLQAAANRTRFLFDQTEALADLAALAAITPVDTMVRHVKSIGFFVFDAASVDAESLPFIVAPSAGAGMWYWSVDAASLRAGLATLDGFGKVVEPVPNRLISATYVPLTTSPTTTSVGYVDVTGFIASIAVEAGDILVIDANLSLNRTLGANEGYAKLIITDAGVDYNAGPIAKSDGVSTPVSRHISVMWTASDVGTIDVRAQFAAGGSSTIRMDGTASLTPGTPGVEGIQSNLRILQIRP